MKMSEKEVDTSNELRVLSLFSGCGGMDLGFEGDFICHRKSMSPQSTWVQEVIDEHWVRLQKNRFRTVFANDILKEAQTAWLQYMDRFGYDKNVYNTKSIVDLVKEHRAGKKVFPKNIDVVTGGFPCQDFSVSGKRLGFESNKDHTGKLREDDEAFKNPVDLMFDELKKRKPDHFAVRQYAKFKLSAGKTAKSILISCGARLAPFDIQELRELTAYDELQLDTLGDRKTALFIIMSDTDDTFNFLISMCYTQLFNLLCEKADDVYGGRLPVHVRCLIDEAANIGQIPRLEKLVATIRSREISCCLVLQAQSQLKALYKDSADTIVGNMDCSIFLGGKEPGTLKELAAALGKETIDSYNTGESRGREVSHSLNYQKLGKELMSVDELAVLDGGKCILQLRGVRPFLSNKYDLTKHPLYRYTADYDKKYAFDIERFLSHRLKLKPDDAVEVYQADLSGEPVA